MNPDLFNACFEGVGALMAWRNAWQLYKDQAVKGVYWPIYFFYTGWGAFNVWYYHAISQPFSWWAGIVLCAGNLAWLTQAIRLWRKR